MRRWKLLLAVVVFFAIKNTSNSYGAISVDPQHTALVYAESGTSFDIKAAKLLQRYLRLSFGSETGFLIAADNKLPTDQRLKISLGMTRYTDASEVEGVKKYGYIIRSFSDTLICLYGQGEVSTLLAATCFLDSIFDIRFYLPGNDFVHCPKRTKMSISHPIFIKSEPFTDYVMATGFLTDFMNEYEVAECWGLIRKDWGSHQHTMSERFPAKKFKSDYAEIYPMMDSVGKPVRYYPKNVNDQSWQPDFSNPSLVDAAVLSTVEYFKNTPKRSHIAFSVQDSGLYPDSEFMKAYLVRYENNQTGRSLAYTHAFIDFLNATAKRLEDELPRHGIDPNKTIVYIAYGQVRQLPPVKLHKHILPVTVYRIAESQVLHLHDSLGKKECIFQPYQWKNITSRIGHHDWAQGYGYLFPRIYPGFWSTYLRDLKKNNLSFEYAHIESYPNWGLDGPKHYILAKQLWNPIVDYDRILRKFCDDMFGSGASGMYEYFKLLELLTIKMNNGNLRRKMWRIPEQLILSENELKLAEKAFSTIDKVSRKSLNPLQTRRVKLFKDTYTLSYLFMKIASSKESIEEDIGQLRDLIHQVTRVEKLSLYWSRNNNAEESLLKHLKSLK